MKKIGINLNKIDMYIDNDKEIEVRIETKEKFINIIINILFKDYNISSKRKIAFKILKNLKKLKCKEIDFSEKCITNKYFHNLQEFFMISGKFFDISIEDVKIKIKSMFESI